MIARLTLLSALAALLLAGCSKPERVREPITWAELIRQLAQPNRIARLDVPGTEIITSVDPAGGNDDYNHFVRAGPSGWIVLADLEGPGYVSRLWMTGGDGSGSHKIRFFLDDEEQPRWDTTWGQWFGGLAPMTLPLAAYESFCWYSYVPIPFQKRLVIMTEAGGTKPGGWPRIFYQVNHNRLPSGQVIESMPGTVTPDAAAAMDEVKQFWSRPAGRPAAPGAEPAFGDVELLPGQETTLVEIAGPAVIEAIGLRFKTPPSAGALARQSALREVVLRFTWDGAGEPSVVVPLGDLCGSFWRPTRFQSLYFGMEDQTLQCRFPMPFAARGVLRARQEGGIPLELSIEATVRRLPAWDPALGYFHAAWSKTFADDVGRPHDVLRTAGSGKFVGCMLSATSFDGSWWLLEGDESIRVDDEASPRWLGTGLEDYFNGGWYYANARARPLHGLPFKAGFRTVQYRAQLPDPVYFTKAIDVVFERGPDQASHGEMESVAWYYMEKPQAAASRLGTTDRRRPPADPHRAATFMMELCNQERLGDYRGAIEYIDAYLEQVRDFPFVRQARLRQLAYRERMEGIDAVWPQYEEFLGGAEPEPVRTQAENLLWFHEDRSHALLVLYCSMPTTAYLDRQAVGEAGDRERAVVYRVALAPGSHELLLRVPDKAPPQLEFVQACLRTHHGTVALTPSWQMAFAAADAPMPEAGDAVWMPLDAADGKGPPEEPFVWTEPNAYVDTQSASLGVRPPSPMPAGTSVSYYRTTFEY